MAKPEEVERVVSHFRETEADRDRLAQEVITLRQALSSQEAENDRIQAENTRLSAERDMYQVRVAVLVNELLTIKNLITDAERKARSESFGREGYIPTGVDTFAARG